MNSSLDLNNNFSNNNAGYTHTGCVDKINTGYFIKAQRFKPETTVDTQNKSTEKMTKSYS